MKVLIFLLILLNLMMLIEIIPKETAKRLQPLLVKGSELQALQRYHGTQALKIDGSRVSIFRDGWIVVRKGEHDG